MSSWARHSRDAGNAQARDSGESKRRCMTAPGEAPAQKHVSIHLPNSSDCGVKIPQATTAQQAFISK